MFLSQQSIGPLEHNFPDATADDRKDLISRLYTSIADGMEDVLGNLPILDQLSLASANIMAATTSSNQQPNLATANQRQAKHSAEFAEAEAELNAFDNKGAAEPFVKPICDLFLEVFELNRKSNWLRGRAVVVVLHQLLGGTIERKIREYTKLILDQESMLNCIQRLNSALEPPPSPLPMSPKSNVSTTRTAKEKLKTRTEASIMLLSLIPGNYIRHSSHPPIALNVLCK
jgi:sorting nexin-25